MIDFQSAGMIHWPFSMSNWLGHGTFEFVISTEQITTKILQVSRVLIKSHLRYCQLPRERFVISMSLYTPVACLRLIGSEQGDLCEDGLLSILPVAMVVWNLFVQTFRLIERK